MFGSWYTILFGGILVLLLIVGIAFGTSALLFPVLVAILLGIGIAIAFAIKRGSEHAGTGAASVSGGPPRGSGRRPDGAPVSGEGSGAPTSPTGRPR